LPAIVCLQLTLCSAADTPGRHKKRADKAERLASVMEGREGRDAFGARSKLKKKKTGGMSERQKQRQKAMPIAARVQQLKNRSTKARNKSNPRHFKGHFKGK
jgi:protein SDA1